MPIAAAKQPRKNQPAHPAQPEQEFASPRQAKSFIRDTTLRLLPPSSPLCCLLDSSPAHHLRYAMLCYAVLRFLSGLFCHYHGEPTKSLPQKPPTRLGRPAEEQKKKSRLGRAPPIIKNTVREPGTGGGRCLAANGLCQKAVVIEPSGQGRQPLRCSCAESAPHSPPPLIFSVSLCGVTTGSVS